MAYGTLKCDNITFTNGGVDQTVTVSGVVQSISGNITATGTIQGAVIIGTSTVSGATVTGNAGQFTTATAATGVFTSQISGATVTGNVGSFTTITGGTVTLTSGVFGAGTASLPSISFSSNPNTGIYSPGADQVAVATNGTGQIFITSNGNLGVSTLSATNVAGKIHARADGDEPKSLLVLQNRDAGGSAGGAINFINGAVDLSDNRYSYIRGIVSGAGQNGNHLVFGTNANGQAASERLRITSAGLVGVGASDPQRPLDVVSNASAETVTFRGASSNNISTLRFNSNNASTNYASIQSRPAYFEVATAASVPLLLTPGAGTGVGIGTTSPAATLDVQGSVGVRDDNGFQWYGTSAATDTKRWDAYTDNSAANTLRFRCLNDAFSAGNTWLQVNRTGTEPTAIILSTGTSEKARIDSSGRLLVGTSTVITGVTGYNDGTFQVSNNTSEQGGAAGLAAFAWDNGTGPNDAPIIQLNKSLSPTKGTHVIVGNGNTLGSLVFGGSDGTNFEQAARIEAQVDGTPGANDMPGRLVFSTTADGASSPTERMRITSGGGVCLNTTSLIDPATGSNDGFSVNTDGFTGISGNGFSPLNIRRRTSDGAIVGFRRDTTLVGTISVTTTATAYNTSSDYRLKENVVAVTDGITRLQQLKPSRFNFIADPDKTVDGFLAHEVQDVVPEAITGEKDAVDDEGNPLYQGIDQSKMVPLLTAALQEAVAKIENLEARLTAAGI